MKTNRFWKKTGTAALLLLLATQNSIAVARAAEKQDLYPEMHLLEEVVASSGERQAMSPTEFRELLTEYDRAAPETGRDVRMDQALIEMQIMTPEQVSMMKKTVDENPESYVTAIQSAFGKPMVGAQFSGCVTGTLVSAGILAGGIYLLGKGQYTADGSPRGAWIGGLWATIGGSIALSAFLIGLADNCKYEGT